MSKEIKYYNFKEAIEDNDIPLFNAINKRIKKNEKIKIGKYSTGPPDILYFVREPIKKNYKKKQNKKFGSYFYIYGMDTSNLFTVEKYINNYKDTQKNFFRNSKNEFAINEILKNSKITKAVFCSYDFFIEKDFRIIFILIHGGLTCIYHVNYFFSNDIK